MTQFRVLQQICGSQFYDHLVLGTTFWETVDEGVAVDREQEFFSVADFFGDMKDLGAKAARVHQTRESCLKTLKMFDGNRAEALKVQEEMSSECDIASLDAMKELSLETQRLKMEQEQEKEKQREKAAREQRKHEQRVMEEEAKARELLQHQEEEEQQRNEQEQERIREMERRSHQQRQAEAAAEKRRKAQQLKDLEIARRKHEEQQERDRKAAEELRQAQEAERRRQENQTQQLVVQLQLQQAEIARMSRMSLQHRSHVSSTCPHDGSWLTFMSQIISEKGCCQNAHGVTPYMVTQYWSRSLLSRTMIAYRTDGNRMLAMQSGGLRLVL